MSTKIYAYDYPLAEIRFHHILFDLPSYDGIENSVGNLSVETNLSFGVDSDSLYCTVAVIAKLTPDAKESVESEDLIEINIEVTGTGRFELEEEHDITEENLNDLSSEEVMSFSNCLDPLIMGKVKTILAEAGIEGVSIPLQLRPTKSVKRAK